MSKKKKSVKKTSKKKPPKIDKDKQNVTPHPTAGRMVTDFEKTLQEQLAAGESQGQKRGRGRPRKETLEPEPQIEITNTIIAQAVKVPFHLWSVNQGVKELRLADSESQALAEPVKQLLDHYVPQLPTIAVAWFSLAVTSYSIMTVRLQILAALRKNKKEGNHTTSASPPSKSAAGSERSAAGDLKNTGPTGFPTVKK